MDIIRGGRSDADNALERGLVTVYGKLLLIKRDS
jgi:hypothetical protein